MRLGGGTRDLDDLGVGLGGGIWGLDDLGWGWEVAPGIWMI